MGIEITSGGVSKTFRYYPYDAFYIDANGNLNTSGNGQQVMKAYFNGVKYYPDEIPDMDIYESSYHVSYKESSIDGKAYIAEHIDEVITALPLINIIEVDDIEVSGTVRFFVPQGVPLRSTLESDYVNEGVCYRHHVYTVKCNVPNEKRTKYGGLLVDICDQMESGYTYDEYVIRLRNGIIYSDGGSDYDYCVTTGNPSEYFYMTDYFKLAHGSRIGIYKDKQPSVWGRPVPYCLTACIGYNNSSGYTEPSFDISRDARYVETGVTEDLVEAIRRLGHGTS